MNRKKFLILLEQILNTTIKQNAYSFKFKQDKPNNLLYCSFDTNDKNDKLVNINITINNNDNEMKIDIQHQDKVEHLSQKQFMAYYNKEYQEIKKAIKKYKEQQFNKKYINTDLNISKKTSTGIPSITQFNELLKKTETEQNNYNIKIQDMSFNFKPLKEQQYDNLYQISFDIKDQNYNKKNIITIIKYYNENNVILKFIISKNNEMNTSQFKDVYPTEFNKLNEAIHIFQKIIKNKNN